MGYCGGIHTKNHFVHSYHIILINLGCFPGTGGKPFLFTLSILFITRSCLFLHFYLFEKCLGGNVTDLAMGREGVPSGRDGGAVRFATVGAASAILRGALPFNFSGFGDRGGKRVVGTPVLFDAGTGKRK